MSDTEAFVREQLPAPPARVLEIGCGKGELALRLAGAGYEVVAVDPEAPTGDIFRRGRIEDVEEPHRFDAVVAVLSLHHVEHLGRAADQAHDLVVPGGVLVVREFAAERLDGRTAAWYYHVRCALAAARGEEEPASSLDGWLSEWNAKRAALHDGGALVAALRERFDVRLLEWGPYLYEWELDPALEPLEELLIDEGSLAATGLRVVGIRR